MAPFLDKQEEATTTESLIRRDGNSDPDASVKLFIPFTILGLIVSLAALFQIILFIFFRYQAPPPEVIENVKVKENIQEEIQNDKPFMLGTWSWPKLRIVILTCAFFAAYQGQQICTFQFFSKFGQNSELQLSEPEAAYVLTGMTAGFAVGRGVAIIAVFKISPRVIICVNLVLVTIANVLLIGWARGSLSILWVSSILFGLGLSSVYASFGAFIERYLYFTNFIGSLVPFWGGVVASIYPLLVGSFIETNPIVLGYLCFFSIAIMIVSLGYVSYLTRRDKTRY